MGAEQATAFMNPGEANIAMCDCRIVIVGPRSGDDSLFELAHLPKDARILATGNTLEEIRQDGELFTEANVILNITGNAQTLAEIINEMPFLTWIHSITAGVDHLLCPEITDNDEITLTNAKGIFSPSLGEYVMLACLHFAKQVPRWLANKQEKRWEKFVVSELRGQTMGIVGYGNIGQACARLAKAFGMRVIGLRRNPENNSTDHIVDETVGMDKLDYVMEQSDFVVVCLALTAETKHFIKAQHLQRCKKSAVFINIGRGALVDEEALVQALSDGTIAGAALDVFTVEPLPESSPLWTLPNVLISSHNADLLKDSRHKSVRFFTENCARFLAKEELHCIVDKNAGY